MKTRNSLVSNSSSASFIIVWRHWDRSNDNDENLLDETIDRLFYDDKIRKSIKEHTQRNEYNNAFVSTFYTSMFNDMTDFEDAAILLTALENHTSDKYEILYKHIEENGM